MCETVGCVWRWFFSPVKVIFHSLKILAFNKLLFTTIMAVTTLPLSTLLISQSITIHPLAAEIRHLEALAHFASTPFESRHVWHESRKDAVFLIRIKALFSLPSYFLSLAAALSAVHSSILASHGVTPTINSAAASLRPNWMRLFVTTIFVYVILFAFSPVPHALAGFTGSRFAVFAIWSGLEVSLMAGLSLGLVVSVAEEKFGWEAIRAGFGLMEGGRVCGWVLSGLFVFGSSFIGSKLERLMDDQDSSIGFEDKLVVIVCYGFLLLWSYVIITVFYCECRKRHPIKEPHQSEEDLEEQQLSVI